MRMIIMLAVVMAIMVGLVLAIVTAATALARTSQEALAGTPITSSTISKIAFAVLWLLVVGVSAGLIGGS
ncbi:MAG: hypothetical protein AAFU80_07060 [Pseudomonadota bacterium]